MGEGRERSANVSIVRLVMPGDTNRHGSLFGGVALSLMDEAAAILATRVARGPVVTAHIDSVDFEAPIWQGQAVEVTARLLKVGRTSLHIAVDTVGEDLETGERKRSTSAVFVFVAIDAEGRPRVVPKD
jgi:acyl-CoA hydrolase